MKNQPLMALSSRSSDHPRLPVPSRASASRRRLPHRLALPGGRAPAADGRPAVRLDLRPDAHRHGQGGAERGQAVDGGQAGLHDGDVDPRERPRGRVVRVESLRSVGGQSGGGVLDGAKRLHHAAGGRHIHLASLGLAQVPPWLFRSGSRFQ